MAYKASTLPTVLLLQPPKTYTFYLHEIFLTKNQDNCYNACRNLRFLPWYHSIPQAPSQGSTWVLPGLYSLLSSKWKQLPQNAKDNAPKFMGEGEGDETKDWGTCCAGENSLVWDHWARNSPSTTGSVCMRKVLNWMTKVLQHWTWHWFLRYGTQSISKRENRKIALHENALKHAPKDTIHRVK